MSNAREAILSRVRQSLGRGTIDEATRAELTARLQTPPVGVQPKFDLSLVERFAKQLTKVSGEFAHVADEVAALAHVQTWLTEKGWPLKLVIDQRLKDLPWPDAFQVEARNAQSSDQVSMTLAFAGAAETGSVLMLSSPDAPTPLNFLPEVHIVLLHHTNLVTHLEDVWAKLRAEVGTPPRTMNFLTGPSRTADVEQTIQLGAHGPRQFMVVLVGGCE